MTNKEFLNQIKKSQAQGFGLIRMKNADYASDDDPFKNFYMAQHILDISCEKAVLVRIVDKITRINNLLDKEAKVKDESVEDSLIDLSNYSLILLALIKDKRKILDYLN